MRRGGERGIEGEEVGVGAERWSVCLSRARWRREKRIRGEQGEERETD